MLSRVSSLVRETRVEICSALNILTEAITDKYLGMPAQVGVQKSDCFQDRSSAS